MTGGPFIQCPVLMNRYRGRYAFYDRFLREVYRWCGIFDVVVMNVCPPERVPRGSFLEVKTMLLSLPKVIVTNPMRLFNSLSWLTSF